ncbi:MAG: hypothetical protein ABH840_02315 [Nanoarchaeota archaeon]
MKGDILLELYDYCKEKYGKKMHEFLEQFADEFPYYIEGIDKDNHLRSFIDWLVLEKVIPETGKLITESYVEEHTEFDEERKQNIFNTKNVIASEFVVIGKKGMNLKIKDRKDGKYYNVVQVSNNPQIQANTMILGRVFPWGNIYRFAGAMMLAQSPMIMDQDIMMHAYEKKEIERAENIILTPSTKLTAILNKYPFQWVDAICDALSLDTTGRKNEKVKDIANELKDNIPNLIQNLPEKSREVLKLIVQNGGYVRYGLLKEYSDEIPLWWNNHPPESDIGILRDCFRIMCPI